MCIDFVLVAGGSYPEQPEIVIGFNLKMNLKCQVHYPHFNGRLTTIAYLEVRNGIPEYSDISIFED